MQNIQFKSWRKYSMRTFYTELDKINILIEIEEYIEQCPSEEEKQEYRKELYEVKDDFLALCESGVFHDAIGKVVNARENWGRMEVEVETEY